MADEAQKKAEPAGERPAPLVLQDAGFGYCDPDTGLCVLPDAGGTVPAGAQPVAPRLA